MAAAGPHPDFFIIGAPKGGTTALAHYLSEHPRIFFSAPKEPHFWDEDHENGRTIHGLSTVDQYLRLFAGADPDQHLAIGEGSTSYLQSRVAVQAIRDFNPDARFLVMLRHPIEVAYGEHGELVRHYHEDVTDFEEAWRLQEQRAAGHCLPRTPGIVQQLQYRDVARFGEQLERLFDVVPESQRLVMLFDDFVADTRGTYQQVLEFLNIPDDGRTDFPKLNQARAYRSGWLGRMYHAPPAIIERPMRVLRSKVMANSGRMKQFVKDMVSVKKPRRNLRPEFRAELLDVFREDILRTAQLLDRDLGHWITDDSPQVKSSDRSAAPVSVAGRNEGHR